MDLRIDELVRRLMEAIPPGLQGVRHDLEDNFRAVLRANLSRLDLLSRDEFLVQSKVLERTRAELERLEARLALLEGQLARQAESAGEGSDLPAPGPGGSAHSP